MIASSIFVSRLLPGDGSFREELSRPCLSQGFGEFLELATLQQDRERGRVLVGQHHQQEMEEDDDAQSHDENQRKRKQRTDGRQLHQHSSVVRWIWREKKNELERKARRGVREGHTHLSQA
jgi:hypothetical protein